MLQSQASIPALPVPEITIVNPFFVLKTILNRSEVLSRTSRKYGFK